MNDASHNELMVTNICRKMIQMANGELNSFVEISQQNTYFSAIAKVLNMLSENWQQRILHIPFVKDEDNSDYLQIFSIVTDKNLLITALSDFGLSILQLEEQSVHGKSLGDYIATQQHQELLEILYKLQEDPKENLKVQLQFTHLSLPRLYEAQVQYSAQEQLYTFHLIGILYRGPKITYDDSKKSRMIQRSLVDIEVQKIYDYITSTKELNEVTYEFLCEKYKINEQQLKTRFKALYNKTVYQYQLEVRLLRAEELIKDTSLSFKAIAFEVGFHDYSNFYRNFVKAYRMKPHEFRNKYQTK
ncbi:MAG: helix-turn-helix domain-containing protein [Flavobacterium sp.]|uniref:helix-turn-helix domain-containing protein n=1 Tax=Flavobacterium sp. TaxID=239 RepID=UPI002FC9ED28